MKTRKDNDMDLVVSDSLEKEKEWIEVPRFLASAAMTGSAISGGRVTEGACIGNRQAGRQIAR